MKITNHKTTALITVLLGLKYTRTYEHSLKKIILISKSLVILTTLDETSSAQHYLKKSIGCHDASNCVILHKFRINLPKIMLIDIKFRKIYYTHGDGFTEFTIKRWFCGRLRAYFGL